MASNKESHFYLRTSLDKESKEPQEPSKIVVLFGEPLNVTLLEKYMPDCYLATIIRDCSDLSELEKLEHPTYLNSGMIRKLNTFLNQKSSTLDLPIAELDYLGGRACSLIRDFSHIDYAIPLHIEDLKELVPWVTDFQTASSSANEGFSPEDLLVVKIKDATPQYKYAIELQISDNFWLSIEAMTTARYILFLLAYHLQSVKLLQYIQPLFETPDAKLNLLPLNNLKPWAKSLSIRFMHFMSRERYCQWLNIHFPSILEQKIDNWIPIADVLVEPHPLELKDVVLTMKDFRGEDICIMPLNYSKWIEWLLNHIFDQPNLTLDWKSKPFWYLKILRQWDSKLLCLHLLYRLSVIDISVFEGLQYSRDEIWDGLVYMSQLHLKYGPFNEKTKAFLFEQLKAPKEYLPEMLNYISQMGNANLLQLYLDNGISLSNYKWDRNIQTDSISDYLKIRCVYKETLFHIRYTNEWARDLLIDYLQLISNYQKAQGILPRDVFEDRWNMLFVEMQNSDIVLGLAYDIFLHRSFTRCHAPSIKVNWRHYTKYINLSRPDFVQKLIAEGHYKYSPTFVRLGTSTLEILYDLKYLNSTEEIKTRMLHQIKENFNVIMDHCQHSGLVMYAIKHIEIYERNYPRYFPTTILGLTRCFQHQVLKDKDIGSALDNMLSYHKPSNMDQGQYYRHIISTCEQFKWFPAPTFWMDLLNICRKLQDHSKVCKDEEASNDLLNLKETLQWLKTVSIYDKEWPLKILDDVNK